MRPLVTHVGGVQWLSAVTRMQLGRGIKDKGREPSTCKCTTCEDTLGILRGPRQWRKEGGVPA